MSIFPSDRAQTGSFHGSCSKRNMTHKSFGLALAVLFAFSTPAVLPGVAAAQSPASARGAQASTDLRAAPPSTRLERMILLLKPSPEQRQALDAELEAQQDPASPEYRRWLTPQAFADRYSRSPQEVAAVTAWLRSQGFDVAAPPAGRQWIEFSGTVAQVEQAFQASIHTLQRPAGERAVLLGDLSLPAELKPLVEGFASLDGVLAAPAMAASAPVKATAAELAAETSIANAEALTPQLAATLLHLDALRAAGISGAGESIAIAARSNVRSEDVAAFRAAFGLLANPLEVKTRGADPGRNEDEAAALLAASWAGAAAPEARIVLAPAATTSATDGLNLSLADIIDEELAQTVAIGFTACESALSEAHRGFYAALYRQASAQGMAVIAAAGDSGAAACHAPGSDALVSTGLSVNALASTPWNTAVGVAAFSAADSSVLAAWSPVNEGDPSYASGGGRSAFHAAPTWQPLPALDLQQQGQQHRLLPDLALPTAIDTALNRGVAFCFSGASPAAGCTLERSGGSSAAAALFAGVAALVAETHGPQGNLAPQLYALSRQSGIFTDVQHGSAILPCAPGSPDCDDSGKIGFAAAAGYDLATGLGMVDAHALVTRWDAAPEVGKGKDTVTIINGGQTINPTALTTITAQVTSDTGGATPTGTVLFYDTTSGKNLTNTASTVEPDGTASLSIEGGFQLGHNAIEAKYSGDATYEANTSSTADIYVTKGTTSLAVVPSTYSPGVGATITATATITVNNFPGNDPPTGNIQLQLDGKPSSTQPVKTASSMSLATFSVVIPSAGGHTLQAIYAGDSNYVTSTSPAVTVTAAASTDSVTITTPGTTINPTALITIDALVTSTSGGAQPTGTVLFYDTTTGKNLSNTPSIVESNGTAYVSIEGGFALGNNNIVAKYSGDSNYPANTSGIVDFYVTAGDTSLAVTPSTYSPAVNVPFNVTAAITVTNFPGNAPPTGTIQLQVDGKSYATMNVTIVKGTPEAVFPVTVSATGNHTLQAIYSGDANYVTSTSSAVAVTAGTSSANATLTTLTASPAVLSAGVPETFTATIAPASGASTTPITGSVKFYDGTTLLGTVAVAADKATLPAVTLSATASHSITAVYSGDANWAASTSNALTLVTATLSDTVTLTANGSNFAPGQVVTLTATVTPTTTPPAGSEQNPAGNVIFYEGTTVLGTAPLVPGVDDTSVATLVIATLPGGQNTIAAVYAGDTTYRSATSNSVTVNVQNFTITPAPGNPLTNLTIVKGSSGSASFIITGQGGFNNEVQVVCATEQPEDMTCTASPQQVIPTATVTFVVQTYSTGTTPPSSARNHRGPLWPGAAGGTALAVLGFFLIPFGRRARIFSSRSARRFCILLALLIGLGGAGIGCNTFNLVSGPGTPLGVATLKITAAAYIDDTVVSKSVYLTVNVVPKS